ncbi:MAG: hypothetical protein K6L80_16080 [Agarilytica sp.]
MRLLLRMALGGLVVIVVAVAVFLLGKQAEPFAPGSQSEQILKQGPFPVGEYQIELVDETRITMANNDIPSKPSRTIETVIWYPKDDGGVAKGLHPLVLYGHGFSSKKEGGEPVGRHLASHGYIVVSPNFPLSHLNAEGGPNVLDFAQQPGDISFLIDTVLGWSITSAHMFEGRIDASRIGMMGMSLGGMTAVLLAYHPKYQDSRIKAFVSAAGGVGIFQESFFGDQRKPFMMIAGDIDAMVNYQNEARPVLDRIKDVHLVTIKGGSHAGFSGASKILRWRKNPDNFFCKLIEKKPVHDEVVPFQDLLDDSMGIAIDPNAGEDCFPKPLPPSLNILRQLMLVKVSSLSFFESHFSDNEQKRKKYFGYLSSGMAKELSEIEYEAAP